MAVVAPEGFQQLARRSPGRHRIKIRELVKSDYSAGLGVFRHGGGLHVRTDIGRRLPCNGGEEDFLRRLADGDRLHADMNIRVQCVPSSHKCVGEFHFLLVGGRPIGKFHLL